MKYNYILLLNSFYLYLVHVENDILPLDAVALLVAKKHTVAFGC